MIPFNRHVTPTRPDNKRKSWRPTRQRGVTRLDASRMGWQNKTFGLNRGAAAAQTIGESDVEQLDEEVNPRWRHRIIPRYVTQDGVTQVRKE